MDILHLLLKIRSQHNYYYYSCRLEVGYSVAFAASRQLSQSKRRDWRQKGVEPNIASITVGQNHLLWRRPIEERKVHPYILPLLRSKHFSSLWSQTLLGPNENDILMCKVWRVSGLDSPVARDKRILFWTIFAKSSGPAP